MKSIVFQILLALFVIPAFPQDNNQAVPYTLADRDRLIKVATKLDGLESHVDDLDKNLNNRIDQLDKNLNSRVDQLDKNLNKRIDGLEGNIHRLEDKFDTYFTWGFGMVLGAIFALFGFILYDRRTTLAPVKREQDKVIEALRELGKEDSKIREALKKAALW